MYHLNDRGQQTTQNTNLVNNASTISHNISSQIYNHRLVNINPSSSNTVHSTQHLSTPTSTYVSNTTALRQWRRSNLKTTPSPHLTDVRNFSPNNNQILVKSSPHIENSKYQAKIPKNVISPNNSNKNNCLIEIQHDKAIINHNSNNNQIYSPFNLTPHTVKQCNYTPNKNASAAYKEEFCPSNIVQSQDSSDFRFSDEGKVGYGENKYMYHPIYQTGNVPFSQIYNEVKQDIPSVCGDMSMVYPYNKLKSTDINNHVTHDLKTMSENSINCHVINYSQSNSFKNENTANNILSYQNPELIGNEFMHMKQVNHNNYKSDIPVQHRNTLSYEYNYKYYANNNYNANIPNLPLHYYHGNNFNNAAYTGNGWPPFYNNNSKAIKQQAHPSYTTDPYTQHLAETEFKIQRGDIYNNVERHDMKSFYNNGIVKHHYPEHMSPKYPVNVPNISNYSYKHSSHHWDQNINMTCAHPTKSAYPSLHATENHCDNILINDKYPFHGISLNGGRIENSVNCAVTPRTSEFYSHSRSNNCISNPHNSNPRPFMQNTSDINVSQYDTEPNIYYNGNKNVPYIHPVWSEDQFNNGIYTNAGYNNKYHDIKNINNFSNQNTSSSSSKNSCFQKQTYENTKCKSSLNLKQFLETWDDAEETEESNVNNLPDVVLSTSNANQNTGISEEPNQDGSQSQMFYILESTNISAEVVQNNYKHIQQIDKLPDNIKLVNDDQKIKQLINEDETCDINKSIKNNISSIVNAINYEIVMNKNETSVFLHKSAEKINSVSENSIGSELKTNTGKCKGFDLTNKNSITKSVIEINPTANDSNKIVGTQNCSLNILNNESLFEVKKQLYENKSLQETDTFYKNSEEQHLGKSNNEIDNKHHTCTENDKNSIYDIQLKRKDTVIKSSNNLNIKCTPILSENSELEKEIKLDSDNSVIKSLKYICQDIIKNHKSSHIIINKNNYNQKHNLLEDNKQILSPSVNKFNQNEKQDLIENKSDSILLSNFNADTDILKEHCDLNENKFEVSKKNDDKTEVPEEINTFNDYLKEKQHVPEENISEDDTIKQDTNLSHVDEQQNRNNDFEKNMLSFNSNETLESVFNSEENQYKENIINEDENISDNTDFAIENVHKTDVNLENQDEKNSTAINDNKHVIDEECDQKISQPIDRENEKMNETSTEDEDLVCESFREHTEKHLNTLKKNTCNTDEIIDKSQSDLSECAQTNKNSYEVKNDDCIETIIDSSLITDSKNEINTEEQISVTDTFENCKDEQIFQINKIIDNKSTATVSQNSETENNNEELSENHLNLNTKLDVQKENDNIIESCDIYERKCNQDVEKLVNAQIELENENVNESTIISNFIDTSELLSENNSENTAQNYESLNKSIDNKHFISKDLKIDIISNEKVNINDTKMNENYLENLVTPNILILNTKPENVLENLTENDNMDDVYSPHENNECNSKCLENEFMHLEKSHDDKKEKEIILNPSLVDNEEIIEQNIKDDTIDTDLIKSSEDDSKENLSEITNSLSLNHEDAENITSSNLNTSDFNQIQKEDIQKSDPIEDREKTFLDKNIQLSSLTDCVEKVQDITDTLKELANSQSTTHTTEIQNDENNLEITSDVPLNSNKVNNVTDIQHGDVSSIIQKKDAENENVLNNSTDNIIENLPDVQNDTDESSIKDFKDDSAFCNVEINSLEEQSKESIDDETLPPKSKFQSNQLILIIQTFDSHNCQEIIPLREQENSTPDSDHVIVQDYEETEITVGSDDENNIYIQIPINGDTHSEKSMLNITEENDVHTDSNQIYEIYNDDIDPLLDNCEVEIENQYNSEVEYSETTSFSNNNDVESEVPINECDSTFQTNDMELQSNEVTESKSIDDNTEISSTCDYYQSGDKIVDENKSFSVHYNSDENDVQNENYIDSKLKENNLEEFETNLNENDVLDDWLYTEEIITSPKHKFSFKNAKFKLKKSKHSHNSYKNNKLNDYKNKHSIKKNICDKKCELNYKDEAIQVSSDSYLYNFHNNNNNNDDDDDDDDEEQNAEVKLKNINTAQRKEMNKSTGGNISNPHKHNNKISISNVFFNSEQNVSDKSELNTCDSTTKNFDLQNYDVAENSSDFSNLHEPEKKSIEMTLNELHSDSIDHLRVDLKRKYEIFNNDGKKEKQVKKFKSCFKNSTDDIFQQSYIDEIRTENELQIDNCETDSKKCTSVPPLKIKSIKPTPSFSDVLQGIDTYVVKQSLSKFKIPKLRDERKNKTHSQLSFDCNRNFKQDSFNVSDHKRSKKIETMSNVDSKNDNKISEPEKHYSHQLNYDCTKTAHDSLKMKFMNTQTSFSSYISDHPDYKEYKKNDDLNFHFSKIKIKKKYLDLNKFESHSKTDFKYKDKSTSSKTSKEKKYRSYRKTIDDSFLLKSENAEKEFHYSQASTSECCFNDSAWEKNDNIVPKVIIKRSAISNKYASTLSDTPLNNVLKWQPFVKLHRNSKLDKMALKLKVEKKIILHINRVNHSSDSFSSLKCKIKLDNKTKKLLPYFKENQYISKTEH